MLSYSWDLEKATLVYLSKGQAWSWMCAQIICVIYLTQKLEVINYFYWRFTLMTGTSLNAHLCCVHLFLTTVLEMRDYITPMLQMKKWKQRKTKLWIFPWSPAYWVAQWKIDPDILGLISKSLTNTSCYQPPLPLPHHYFIWMKKYSVPQDYTIYVNKSKCSRLEKW